MSAMFTVSYSSYAEIYKCKNGNGVITYKDAECLPGESLIERPDEELNIVSKENDTGALFNNNLKVIFEGKLTSIILKFL